MTISYIKETSDAIDTTKRDRLLNDTVEKGTIFNRIYMKHFFFWIYSPSR